MSGEIVRGGAPSAGERRWVLLVLTAIYAVNFIDRTVINTVGQAIKLDLKLSDFQVGLLGGAAFAIINGLSSIPFARLAERFNRVTILSAALTFWSLMTMACGFAGSFWQLCAARFGVGIGEAGSPAASQSLLADHFPPSQRGRALAIFICGAPIGILVGAVATSWITQHFGWRMAFAAIGLPGIALGLLIRITTRDPYRQAKGSDAECDVPSLRSVLLMLIRSATYRQMLAATALLNAGIFGFLLFMHPYFVRVHALSYAEAGAIYGFVNGIGNIAGYLLGGFAADRFGIRDRRFYAWIPAFGALFAVPCYAVALLQSSLPLSAAMFFVGGAATSIYFAPFFSLLNDMVVPRARATAVAISALVNNLLGVALGGMAIGLLSDFFAARSLGAENMSSCAMAAADSSLRRACENASATGVVNALICAAAILVWAALHYLWAAHHLRKVD